MSRLLFTRRPARLLPDHDEEDPASAYSSLLDQDDPAAAGAERSAFPQRSQSLRYGHRRAKSSPKVYTAATQNAAVRRQPSWSGERPAMRKLVKEPTAGSARPSFSVEISDGDGDAGTPHGKDKGKAGSSTVRRSILRLRDYWKGEK